MLKYMYFINQTISLCCNQDNSINDLPQDCLIDADFKLHAKDLHIQRIDNGHLELRNLGLGALRKRFTNKKF